MRMSEFSRSALGQAERNVKPVFAMVPGIDAPMQTISKIFDFQSYFDSTLLQKALLEQSPNEAIVASTMDEAQISGYALGLSPASQTPVAVQFKVGSGQQSSSAPQILRPGDIIRPMGEKGKAFSGFKWGLPFGWLGGGSATLVVFPNAEADAKWLGGAEVIFHRARFAIKQPADLTLAGSFNNAPKNWPMRFPWSQALQSSGSIVQQSHPAIAIVEPTRVMLALRGITTVAAGAGARVRAIFQGSNDLGLDSAGDPVLTTPVFEEYTFPEFSSIGTSGNMATQNPALVFKDGVIARIAADDGGMLFVDNSTVAATLTDGFVDVVRYGRL